MTLGKTIFGVLLSVSSILLIFWVIPAQTTTSEYTSLQPAVYSLIPAWGLLIVGVLATLQGLRSAPNVDDIQLPVVPYLLRASILAMACLVFIVLVERIGFLVMSPVLIALAAVAQGARNPISIAGVSVAVPLTIWLIFDLMLNRPLP